MKISRHQLEIWWSQVYWRCVSGASKRIFATINSATLLTRWRKWLKLKINISCYFNRWIDTVNITALSNHKPGILNNYIRICYIILFIIKGGGEYDKLQIIDVDCEYYELSKDIHLNNWSVIASRKSVGILTSKLVCTLASNSVCILTSKSMCTLTSKPVYILTSKSVCILTSKSVCIYSTWSLCLANHGLTFFVVYPGFF